MKNAMEKAGAKFDELFIGAEPATARNTLQSFLQANPDTNYIFTVAGCWSPSAAFLRPKPSNATTPC